MTDEDDLEKYIAFVEADAGVSVMAESPEAAEEKLESVTRTGHLGPPKVRNVKPFDDDEDGDGADTEDGDET